MGRTADPIQVLIDRIVRDSLKLQELYHPVPPEPPANVLTVATADELTAALATVAGGSEIRLKPGTYTGNFVLRKREDAARVLVRADLPDADIEPASMPWIVPAQAMAFPQLRPLDPGLPILACADGAAGYTVFGLAIGPNTVRPDYTLVELGSGNATDLSQVPTDIVVDCCYIHGDPAVGCRRGVSLQSSRTTIRRCYISDCWYRGQDAQAIACWASPGELLIEDNYLAGSGENLIIGGSDPKIPNLVPTDIVIRGNHIYKPLDWKQFPGSVKNSLELKNARLVLIEDNVLEYCWVDGQPGHCVVFTVRNQDGGAPWSTVADVTFRWNVVTHVEGSFVNLLGIDDNHPCVRGDGMTIANNLFVDGGGGIQSLSGYLRTDISHNTIQGPQWKFLSFGGQPLPPDEFAFCDNAVGPTEYGITGDDCGIGVPSLERYAPGAEMTCNAIGQSPGWVEYPQDNYLIPAGSPYADYVQHDAGDGAPVGVDLDELQRRIPWFALPPVVRSRMCF